MCVAGTARPTEVGVTKQVTVPLPDQETMDSEVKGQSCPGSHQNSQVQLSPTWLWRPRSATTTLCGGSRQHGQPLLHASATRYPCPCVRWTNTDVVIPGLPLRPPCSMLSSLGCEPKHSCHGVHANLHLADFWVSRPDYTLGTNLGVTILTQNPLVSFPRWPERGLLREGGWFVGIKKKKIQGVIYKSNFLKAATLQFWNSKHFP